MFYVPVEDADLSFTLYMTPAVVMTSVVIKILAMDGTELLSRQISQTSVVEKSSLNPLNWDNGVGIHIIKENS